MRNEIEELLACPLMVHCGTDYNDVDGPGQTMWTVEPPFLSFLESVVGPGCRTLEFNGTYPDFSGRETTVALTIQLPSSAPRDGASEQRRLGLALRRLAIVDRAPR